MEPTEDYLPVGAEQAAGWLVALEAQFTDADWRRHGTATDFWATHPASMRQAANWCSPWDSTFNLWFQARKIWQRCVESGPSLLVGAELVRAVEERINDRYCFVPAEQACAWDWALEEFGFETLDFEIASERFELLECLRRAIETIPGTDSFVVIGPDYRESARDLISDVEEMLAIYRMEGA